MTFSGKAVWITGASSGIGEALAMAFAAQGARLILSARRRDELERVQGSLRPPSFVLPFDAVDLDILPGVVHEALRWSGGIDVLINNAGVSQRSPVVETSFAVYRQLMELDFFAPVRLTQLVLPHMMEKKSGCIVAVASMAGKFGMPYRSGYCAAKHAMVGFFDALRAEISESGVRISVVTPGFVRTQIAANALRGDGGRAAGTDANIAAGMDPQAAASVILKGIARGKREIPVGLIRDRSALLLKRLWPGKFLDVMASQARDLG